MTTWRLPPMEHAWRGQQLADDVTVLLADNPGPLTLDGTNTYVLQADDTTVVVDPGPALASHHATITSAVSHIDLIVLTHGHGDHREVAGALAEIYSSPVRAVDAQWCVRATTLDDDESLQLGPLELRVLHTPGHTPDSASLAATWQDGRRALFTGDTILGRGTSFVGHPEGTLAAYLASLRRLGAVATPDTVVLPGHGPAHVDAHALVASYVAHRNARLDEVRAAWLEGAQSPDEVVDVVYGPLTGPLREAARSSAMAQLHYLGLLSA